MGRTGRNAVGCAALAALAALALGSGRALARDLWESADGERSLSLTTTIKATTVMPESDEAANLWRLRLGLAADSGERVHAELAYEQRTRSSPGAIGSATGLPPDAPAPFRLAQLDCAIVEEGTYSYRHELDRAFVAFKSERADVTVGRQAIGWGRGALFGAVDVFSPFSPLEVDREWRRGVDAIRADIRSRGHGSLDVVLAGGETWDESALLGRVRGRTDSGELDGEVAFGKRGEDIVYAGGFSASIPGGASVYGELAFFDTPEHFENGGLFGSDGAVAKTVLGAWHRFDIGNGLVLRAEHHFSGFGIDDMSTAAARLADPDYLARLMRGDMTILGRHAVAFQASYELSDEWTTGLAIVGNPGDGSGVVTPSFTWDFSDNVTLSMSAFLPYGREADGLVRRSEYGDAPVSVFLQVKICD